MKDKDSDCGEQISYCKKYARFLTIGKITADEFAYNVILYILHGSDSCMRVVVQSLQDHEHTLVKDLLSSVLETEGILAFVFPFVVDRGCDTEIERKKHMIELKVGSLIRLFDERHS